MQDAAIGAVIYNNTLTIAVRRGNVLGDPIQQPVRDAQHAAAVLLAEKVKLKHDDPVIYLEGGDAADAVLAEIQKYDERSRDQIVDGLGPASARYANRRSELHKAFRKRVEEDRLRVPMAYHDQLDAFRREERDGKVFSPSPDDVAVKLGRFPAFAVAAVLAAIEAYAGGVAQSLHEWDPHEDD